MEILELSRNLNAYHYDGLKPVIDKDVLVGVVDGQLKELAVIRWYGKKRIYCSIWVANECSGKGSATGYGIAAYNAALLKALESAGVVHTGEIGGYRDVFNAIAAFYRADQVLII